MGIFASLAAEPRYREHIVFTVLSVPDKVAMKFIEHYTLDDQFPTALILDHGPKPEQTQSGSTQQTQTPRAATKRYDFPHATGADPLNPEDARRFLDDFIAGGDRAARMRKLKSDPPSFDGSGGGGGESASAKSKVKTLVGDDFKKHVVDTPNTHVLVEFYAPW